MTFKKHQTGLTGLEPATSGVTDRHSNQTELQPLPCTAPDKVRVLPPDLRSGFLLRTFVRFPAYAPTGNRTPISTLKEWCPSR